MSDQLASCPFCGGAAYQTSGGTGSGAYFATGCHSHKCPAGVHALVHKSQAEADAAWNARSPQRLKAVARIRTWHKGPDQHAELEDWCGGIENLPDGTHVLYGTAGGR